MSKTILLADDSVTIQKVVELTFMDQDTEVVTVGDGEAALDKLDGTAPDLLIADVHMPGIDGYEVCRRAKESRPDLPVLLLVGTFEPFDPQQYERSGADAYLKKPFDSQELLRQVDELVGAAAAPPAPAAPKPAAERPAPAPVAKPAEAPPAARAEAPAAGPAAATPPPATPAATPPGRAAGGLSDDDVERIARRVVELLGENAVREVAWEVVPDLAEVVVRERLRELEGQVD